MFPPRIKDFLNNLGHDAILPADLGAHNLPDDVLVNIATAERRVIVTENASDFAQVTTCTVLLVRKTWWPRGRLGDGLGRALDAWSAANPDPGPWSHWLEAEFR
jgi:hypothetical protein